MISYRSSRLDSLLIVRFQRGQKFSIQSPFVSCHCLHRWERQLRLLTEVWKHLTQDNSTFCECYPLRIPSSFKRFFRCVFKVLGLVQSAKCFVLKWEIASRFSTRVVKSFLRLDTDFVDIHFRVPQCNLYKHGFSYKYKFHVLQKGCWFLWAIRTSFGPSRSNAG